MATTQPYCLPADDAQILGGGRRVRNRSGCCHRSGLRVQICSAEDSADEIQQTFSVCHRGKHGSLVPWQSGPALSWDSFRNPQADPEEAMRILQLIHLLVVGDLLNRLTNKVLRIILMVGSLITLVRYGFLLSSFIRDWH